MGADDALVKSAGAVAGAEKTLNEKNGGVKKEQELADAKSKANIARAAAAIAPGPASLAALGVAEANAGV